MKPAGTERDEAELGAPPIPHRLIRAMLPARLHPWVRALRKTLDPARRKLSEPYRSVFPYTQAHPTRQQNLLRLAGLVQEAGIPGDIVECGVLDGGTAALMAWATRDTPQRKIHLFDAWRGLPRPSSQDGDAAAGWAGQVVGSPLRVRAVMRRLGIAESRLVFHEGWFADTFPRAEIDRIALLHIDPDFYDPVKLCLETWEPKLSPGGFIQLDDYAVFIGCRRAADEYLATHPGLELATFGHPGTAYYLTKAKAVAR